MLLPRYNTWPDHGVPTQSGRVYCDDVIGMLQAVNTSVEEKASQPHLDLSHAPCSVHGVKYVRLVSLMSHRQSLKRKPVNHQSITSLNHLTLTCIGPPYNSYGVKYIDPVSLAPLAPFFSISNYLKLSQIITSRPFLFLKWRTIWI